MPDQLSIAKRSPLRKEFTAEQLSCYLPPDATDLTVESLRGNEGVGEVYNTTITFEQLLKYFNVATTSFDEIDKMQRDPKRTRQRNIGNYLLSRKNTIFPALTAVVNRIITTRPVPNKRMSMVTLPAHAQRMLIDGQGRRLGVEDAFKVLTSGLFDGYTPEECQARLEELKTHTVDLKIVPTNTDTLLEAKEMIRQIFADYHRNVVKPAKSMNLFFDTSVASSRFLMEAYRAVQELSPGAERLISLEGNKARVWDLSQFKTFAQRMTQMTEKEMNTLYPDNPELMDMHVQLLLELFNQLLLSTPAFADMINGRLSHTEGRSTLVHCTAIGLEAIGYVGAMLLSQAMTAGTFEMSSIFDPLSRLSHIDFQRSSTLWRGLVLDVDGNIIKGSALPMARVIALNVGITIPAEFR